MGEAYLRAYIGALVAAAVALAGSWIYWYGLEVEPRFVVGVLIFATFILLSDIFPIRVSGHTTLGVWDVGMVIAVAMLGPTWAAIAALPSALFVGRLNWLRTTYEMSHNVIVVHLAGIAFSLASAPLMFGNPVSTTQAVYGSFVAGLVLLTANKTITIALLKVKYDQSVRETWEKDLNPYLVSDAVNVLTASLGVMALMIYGPVAAIVVVAGSVGSQALIYRSREQVQENRRLKERVRSLEEALNISNMTFGAMVIEDLGRRDGYTHRHAAATARYAADIARELRLDEGRVERLRVAGLLHNVGMFSLPDEILLAEGKLNSIAQSELAEHPIRGEVAFASVPEFREMAGWVRWHHERVDGRGYPDRLRGPWIPLEAKILAVAQAYAAMILDKPRRPGLSPREARERLSAGIDTEFDGVVVRAFLRVLDTESEGYRMADDDRFLFPAPRDAEPPESGARDS